MIVICEDCAKKYNVDEARIKGEKARFSCYECGHIIVVKKPQPVKPFSEASEELEAHNMSEPPEIMEMNGEDDMTSVESGDSLEEQQEKDNPISREKGRFTGTLFKVTIIIAILVIGGISVYMYL